MKDSVVADRGFESFSPPHRYHELIDMIASIDCNLPSKVGFEFALLDTARCVIVQELR